MAFFGVNFILQKIWLCKKNDKYEVCARLMTNESTDLIGFWTPDLLSRFAWQSFESKVVNQDYLFQKKWKGKCWCRSFVNVYIFFNQRKYYKPTSLHFACTWLISCLAPVYIAYYMISAIKKFVLGSQMRHILPSPRIYRLLYDIYYQEVCIGFAYQRYPA